jgi:hypothetical protein
VLSRSVSSHQGAHSDVRLAFDAGQVTGRRELLRSSELLRLAFGLPTLLSRSRGSRVGTGIVVVVGAGSSSSALPALGSSRLLGRVLCSGLAVRAGPAVLLVQRAVLLAELAGALADRVVGRACVVVSYVGTYVGDVMAAGATRTGEGVGGEPLVVFLGEAGGVEHEEEELGGLVWYWGMWRVEVPFSRCRPSRRTVGVSLCVR